MTQTATQAAWNGIDPKELTTKAAESTARYKEMDDWTNEELNNDMDDPDIARETRRREACEAALKRTDEMMPTGGNIDLLHDLVNEVYDLDPEDEVGNMRMWPSKTAMQDAGDGLTPDEIAEKIHTGGWNPAVDRFMRINEDGDWEGFDTQTADQFVWDFRDTIIGHAMEHDISPTSVARIERIEMLPPDPWKNININDLSQNGPATNPFYPSAAATPSDPWAGVGLLPEPDPMTLPDMGADTSGGLNM